MGACSVWGPDLDEASQAEVDTAGLLWDLNMADGDVRHDGQEQGLEHLVETVWKPLGTGHLVRHNTLIYRCRRDGDPGHVNLWAERQFRSIRAES